MLQNKKIFHAWSVACAKSIIDSSSNLISLLDAFEQLDVEIKIKKDRLDKNQVFNVPVKYEIVSLWYKGDQTEKVNFETKIELLDPSKKSLKTFQQAFKIPTDKKRIRTRVQVTGMPMTTPGIYNFNIYIKQDEKEYSKVATLPLQINIKKIKSKVSKPKN